jgi:chromosome partitioning protein
MSLASAEYELYDLCESDELPYRMKTVLEPIQNDFDYVIVDCPPSLGMLTINSFTASDGIVVPMQCEFYALEGLSQLLITIKRINKLYNPKVGVCGILITMYNKRLLLSAQVISELEKHYGDKLLSTQISRNVKLSEAPSFGKPVYYHDKRAKATLEYIAVAKELSQRI